MKKKNFANGMTLIEVMIIVAILGVVALLGTNLIKISTQFFRQAMAQINIQRDNRTSMDLIQKRLSEAKGPSIVIDRLDPSQPFYSRVTFNDMDGRTCSFFQKGTKLYQQTTSGITTSSTMLADNLKQIMFAYATSHNPKLISVSMASEVATTQGESKSLQMQLGRVRIQNPYAN